MPAAYIHEKIAKKALEIITDKPFFMANNIDAFELGAQGPDVLFFYNVLNFLDKDTRPNHLGSRIHEEHVNDFFRVALLSSKEQQGAAPAWLLGFVSHYAADCTVHPFVYATTNNEDGSSNSTRHLVLESQFDTWYYRAKGEKGIPRQARCITDINDLQKTDIANVLFKSCEIVFPESKLSFRQAFKTIGDMDKIICILFSTRRIKHNIFSFIEKLIGQPQIITRHAAAQRLPDYDFLNLEKNSWKNPWDDNNEFSYSFPELFELAVLKSVEYINAVIDFFDDKISIDEVLEVLGDNNYNSGLSIKC